MFDILFGWRKASKCKRLIRSVQCRLKLLKNKRSTIVRQLREDVAELLKHGHSQTAFDRVEQLFKDESLVAVYDLLDQFCERIIINLPYIRNSRDCPDDINEAVSSLIFASTRFGGLPELRSIGKLFGERYGQRLVTLALELLPGNLVNRQMKEKASIKSVPHDVKSKLVEEIIRNSLHSGPLLLDYCSQKQHNLANESSDDPILSAETICERNEVDDLQKSNTTEEGKVVHVDFSSENNCLKDLSPSLLRSKTKFPSTYSIRVQETPLSTSESDLGLVTSAQTNSPCHYETSGLQHLGGALVVNDSALGHEEGSEAVDESSDDPILSAETICERNEVDDLQKSNTTEEGKVVHVDFSSENNCSKDLSPSLLRSKTTFPSTYSIRVQETPLSTSESDLGLVTSAQTNSPCHYETSGLQHLGGALVVNDSALGHEEGSEAVDESSDDPILSAETICERNEVDDLQKSNTTEEGKVVHVDFSSENNCSKDLSPFLLRSKTTFPSTYSIRVQETPLSTSESDLGLVTSAQTNSPCHYETSGLQHLGGALVVNDSALGHEEGSEAVDESSDDPILSAEIICERNEVDDLQKSNTTEEGKVVHVDFSSENNCLKDLSPSLLRSKTTFPSTYSIRVQETPLSTSESDLGLVTSAQTNSPCHYETSGLQHLGGALVVNDSALGHEEGSEAVESSSQGSTQLFKEMIYIDDILEFQSPLSKEGNFQDQRLFKFKSSVLPIGGKTHNPNDEAPDEDQYDSDNEKAASRSFRKSRNIGSSKRVRRKSVSGDATSMNDIQCAIYYGKSYNSSPNDDQKSPYKKKHQKKIPIMQHQKVYYAQEIPDHPPFINSFSFARCTNDHTTLSNNKRISSNKMLNNCSLEHPCYFCPCDEKDNGDYLPRKLKIQIELCHCHCPCNKNPKIQEAGKDPKIQETGDGMLLNQPTNKSVDATIPTLLISTSSGASSPSTSKEGKPTYTRARTMPHARPKDETIDSMLRSNSVPFKGPENSSRHVHPKLPDYDELAAKFMALKKANLQK